MKVIKKRFETTSVIKMLKTLLDKQSNLCMYVYDNHPWDPKVVVVVDRWSLFKGHLCHTWDLKTVVAVERWSLFCMVVSSDLTVLQNLENVFVFKSQNVSMKVKF